jgi:hypothetical protein
MPGQWQFAGRGIHLFGSGSADSLALPERGRTPRHFQSRKSLKERGNRVFRLRLIFGQDAQ